MGCSLCILPLEGGEFSGSWRGSVSLNCRWRWTVGKVYSYLGGIRWRNEISLWRLWCIDGLALSRSPLLDSQEMVNILALKRLKMAQLTSSFLSL